MPPATKDDLDRFEERMKETFSLHLKPIKDAVAEHHDTLYGCDESPGLRVKVDRLEVQAERQKWALRAAGGAAIAAIVSAGASALAWVRSHTP